MHSTLDTKKSLPDTHHVLGVWYLAKNLLTCRLEDPAIKLPTVQLVDNLLSHSWEKKAKTETVFMPRGCTREPLMLFSKMF